LNTTNLLTNICINFHLNCKNFVSQILGSLEEITIPQNGIRPEGIAILSEAFKGNHNLKVLIFDR